jgi:hypothetical protein
MPALDDDLAGAQAIQNAHVVVAADPLMRTNTRLELTIALTRCCRIGNAIWAAASISAVVGEKE